jgi:serine O-acetyltransferase
MKEFQDADLRSLSIKKHSIKYFLDDIWRFQKTLRELEYLMNCHKSRVRVLTKRWLFKQKSVRLGFSISPNTFGPGLSIAHRGLVVVNGGAVIGANCRIHAGVVIGTAAGTSSNAPMIGNNCYIGPGAKIFGPIAIGDFTAIGANAVVNKSFPEGFQTLGGVTARVISPQSSSGLLIEGYSNY